MGPAQGHLGFRSSAPQNHILFTPLLVSAKFLSYSCLQLPFKSEKCYHLSVFSPLWALSPKPTGCDEIVGLKFAEILSGPTPLLPLAPKYKLCFSLYLVPKVKG